MVPREIYQKRLNDWRIVLELEDKRYSRLSDLRLWIVIAGIAIAIWSWPWVFVPLAAFIALVVLHSRVDDRRTAARRGISYFERGLNRIDGKWGGSGTSGDRFRDSHHVFSDDLDVFGTGSLFELLCTARTSAGQETLAEWLLTPASPAQLESRHEAVRELAPQVDMREQAALTGEDIHANWRMKAMPEFPAYAQPFASLVSGSALIAGVGFAAGWWNSSPLLVVVLVALPLTYWFRPQIFLGLDALEASARELDLLVRLLRNLEQAEFRSPLLNSLRDRVKGSSKEVAYLKRLITLADTGRNAYLLPITLPLMWTMHVALAVWRLVLLSAAVVFIFLKGA